MQAYLSFGAPPFLIPSSVPDTYDMILLIYATSTSIYSNFHNSIVGLHCQRKISARKAVLLRFTVAVNFPRMSGQYMVLIGTRSRSVKRAAVLTLQTTQRKNRRASRDPYEDHTLPSHTLLDRQRVNSNFRISGAVMFVNPYLYFVLCF